MSNGFNNLVDEALVEIKGCSNTNLLEKIEEKYTDVFRRIIVGCRQEGANQQNIRNIENAVTKIDTAFERKKKALGQ